MKIIYMGTPDFAVAPLVALAENGYEVEAVITQPDKPKGRGKTMIYSCKRRSTETRDPGTAAGEGKRS